MLVSHQLFSLKTLSISYCSFLTFSLGKDSSHFNNRTKSRQVRILIMLSTACVNDMSIIDLNALPIPSVQSLDTWLSYGLNILLCFLVRNKHWLCLPAFLLGILKYLPHFVFLWAVLFSFFSSKPWSFFAFFKDNSESGIFHSKWIQWWELG